MSVWLVRELILDVPIELLRSHLDFVSSAQNESHGFRLGNTQIYFLGTRCFTHVLIKSMRAVERWFSLVPKFLVMVPSTDSMQLRGSSSASSDQQCVTFCTRYHALCDVWALDSSQSMVIGSHVLFQKGNIKTKLWNAVWILQYQQIYSKQWGIPCRI